MQGKCVAKFQRISYRKVNQVLDLIRAKHAEEAFKILQFLPKAATQVVEKTLHSAVSNLGRAADPKNTVVKEAYATQGPAIKRMRPAAMGRGVTYKRKMCHVTIVVGEK